MFTDCSEIADVLYDLAGGQGKIIRVTPEKTGELNILEYGDEVPNIGYHDIYTDGRYIYDPRLNSKPVPQGDWEKLIKALNPEGVKFKIRDRNNGNFYP